MNEMHGNGIVGTRQSTDENRRFHLFDLLIKIFFVFSSEFFRKEMQMTVSVNAKMRRQTAYIDTFNE